MNNTPYEDQPWAIALLRDGFSRVHEGIESLLEEAEPEMLGFRASDNSNSAGWLIWHLTRVQDDHFAHLVHALDPGESDEQLWSSADWAARFDLPHPKSDTGFGHSSEQVAAFGTPGVENLRGYHQDVHNKSLQVLDALEESDLGTVIDTRWDPPVTAASRLMSILGETTSHLGQAQFQRGIFNDSNVAEPKDD